MIKFSELGYRSCHTAVDRWYADSLSKTTLHYSSASLYYDCIVHVSKRIDKHYMHGEKKNRQTRFPTHFGRYQEIRPLARTIIQVLFKSFAPCLYNTVSCQSTVEMINPSWQWNNYGWLLLILAL